MFEGRISIDRVQVLLEPDPDDEREVEGILNPAVAGNYLLYWAGGRGNYSRVMAAELSAEGSGIGAHITGAPRSSECEGYGGPQYESG